mmetsp:Transcript_15009/g.22904  ORF Transcript_15009/g.22904 Transcript_15009/m.22904 type:complete len:269 (+) Transcript_15009:66-872(+)
MWKCAAFLFLWLKLNVYHPSAFSLFASHPNNNNCLSRAGLQAANNVHLREKIPSQETLASLSQRLKEYCSEKEEDVTTARMSLLYTRLPNLALTRTFVGPSNISGRGLFAQCDCRKGDLLTCYPGDALIISPDGEEDWVILWGDHVKDNYEIDELLGYIIHAKDDFGVLGLPSLDQDPAYFGHFANDGASMPLTEASLGLYVIESNEKANAMHESLDDCHMVTIATRDITAGEEIFVTYGPDYWEGQPQFVGIDHYDSAHSSTGKGFG